MNRLELKKNTLDLQYTAELQKANALLVLLTIGILGFIGTFIWLKNDLLIIGIIIALVITSIGISSILKLIKE
ncbi:hypothetical protein J4440_06895 [Candidatus Woesearchaeota archaeon]|nr:hypothetical protein [Candidatus Woesearchaeota archaeon]